MAESFNFELVSPESLLLSAEASIVSVPGIDGDMGIMGNHAPVMTSLRPGLVSAELADGSTAVYFVRGGFADITPDALTVLAEFAVPQADVTPELMAEQKRLAVEAVEAADSDEAKANAQSYLDQLTHIEGAILPA